MTKKALIVVDAQYDFMPVRKEDYANGMGGALAVPEGDKIVPIINKLLPKFELVIFTKDWHPANHKSFASQHDGEDEFNMIQLNGLDQVLWPDHCVQNTRGSDIHDKIDFGKIDGDFYIFKKGMDPEVDSYSAFYDNDRRNSTGLKEFLEKRGVIETFICGLALDFCVEYTAIDSAMEGFDTVVIEDGTRPLNSNINDTLQKFQEAGVKLIESWELDFYNATK
jgi:nicotinamidase/pyrazinamidase